MSEFKKSIEDLVEQLALTEEQKSILVTILLEGRGIEYILKRLQLSEEKKELLRNNPLSVVMEKILNKTLLTDISIEKEIQKSDSLMSKITEKQNDLLKAGVRAINVLMECEDWHTGQLDKMSNEQLILIIHKQFVDNIKEISKLRNKKMARINILFYNAVFNEILNRLDLPTLKVIYKKYK